MRIEIDRKGGDPKRIVERAVERRRAAEREARRRDDANLRFDEVWCVFDVDEHARLADALQLARTNHISLAVSNPCFELWLLLHFLDQTAFLECASATEILRGFVGEYDKHLHFESFRNGYAIAVERAERLEKRLMAAERPGGNPSTGVFRLTEQIRVLGRRGRWG